MFTSSREERDDFIVFLTPMEYLRGAYLQGNIDDLSQRADFKGKGVLYCGDHIYTDLADPILRFVERLSFYSH